MAASACPCEHPGCRWQGQVRTDRRGEVARTCEDVRVRDEGRHLGSVGRMCMCAHVDVQRGQGGDSGGKWEQGSGIQLLDVALEATMEQQQRRQLE